MRTKLVEKITHSAADSTEYALRNKKDVKIFIPNISTKLNDKKKIAKRKLIKKLPKDKSLKEKKGLKKQGKVKALSSEIKKQKNRKIRALVIEKSRKSSKQTKRTLTSSKKKNQKSLSKSNSSPKGARISLRLKKFKKVQELIGDTIIQAKRLRSKNLNGRKSQSLRGISLKKLNKQQNRKQKVDITNLKKIENKVKQTKRTSLKKYRPKSSSKSKGSQLAPNIKVIPPKRVKKNLNTISKITPELRSQDESVISKASDVSKSKQVQTRFKTIAELQRINRSRQQRIFLLNAQRVQNEGWTFKVIGTKGKIYETKVSTNAVCTCFDFRSKRKPCKHIYFIVTQIAQNEKILEGFTSQGTITEAAYNDLNQNLYRRLKARIQGEKAEGEMKLQIDLKDDKDCVICFTEMSQSGQILQDCKTCKKYFHDACIKKWKSHNNSCPLCRSQFAVSKDQRDPLQKFQELKI